MSELQKYTWLRDGRVIAKDGVQVVMAHRFEMYEAAQVDAARAADKARIEELERGTEAQHKVLQQALDGCDRVDNLNGELEDKIELLNRAVEWCLQMGTKRSSGDGDRFYDHGCGCCSDNIQIPAEFADIIKAVKP